VGRSVGRIHGIDFGRHRGVFKRHGDCDNAVATLNVFVGPMVFSRNGIDMVFGIIFVIGGVFMPFRIPEITVTTVFLFQSEYGCLVVADL
jgi:hypothetical protein